jgi:chromosome partitioning protein
VLDPGEWGGNDGRVTESAPSTGEMEERGKAIFARLRNRSTPDAAAEAPTPADAAGEADLSALPPPPSPPPADDEPTEPAEASVDADLDAGTDADPEAEGPADAPEAEPITDSAGAGSDVPAPPPEGADVSSLTEAAEVAAEAVPEPIPEPDAEAPPAAPGPRVTPPLPRIIAVANQKGGVGKTTTAVNLGACLADIGYRTLVVDLDPQGNASTGLGINIRGLQSSMYDVILNDVPIEDCVEASSVRNLFVAPASLDLAGAEIELVPAFSRELRLKQALAEVRDDYDYVLIDCPPSLGLLTINGMAAATEVLVPIQCEYYALEGLGQLLRNVGLVQKNLNPTLEVHTIVLVMYDARTKLSDQVAEEVREHFGEKVCRIMIPRTVRLSEAPSFGQPIIAFDPSSRGAIAYRELAREVSGGPA